MTNKNILREIMNNYLVERSIAKGNHIREDKTPDQLYEEYLTKHVSGVLDAYNNILKDKLDMSPEELDEVEKIIEQHDQYKRQPEEWDAYRNYFYDPDNNPRSNSEEFNQAWNHHQNHSPHHWQYWCLINDVDHPQLQPLDMPMKYIVEMLCDWQSAGNHYGNTAYEWYERQKDRMILSDNTRKIVEQYIQYFK